MQDDFLSRCVVDPVARKFYLYSEQGEEKVVDCETVDQFMDVLEVCRAMLDEDTLAYATPLWPKLAFNSKKDGKKIPGQKRPITFSMRIHPPSLYKEIIECYEYETRNPTIYGNVVRCPMEFTQGSKKLQSDRQGDENNV